MQDIEFTYNENKKALLLCFLLWLFFPLPLLFITRPLRSFWIRLILCLFSPIIIFCGIDVFNFGERRYKYSQEEIECIIGIELPKYKVVNYEEKELNTHLLRGHSMTKELEFVQIPQQNFYNKLDSLCNIEDESWQTEEYISILDSLIKSNGMDWTEYYIGDRKEEMDSIAKQIMVVNNIQPIHYKFTGDIKLYIERGSKNATLIYSDWVLQKN